MPSADAAVAIAKALGVSVEFLVTGHVDRKKGVRYPTETRVIADIIAQLSDKTRRMAVAIIKSMKKQEDEEKKQDLAK